MGTQKSGQENRQPQRIRAARSTMGIMKFAARWPSALALVAIAGAITLILTSDEGEAEFFGPAITTMAAIYVMAYAAGRKWVAWLAFAVLSVVMGVFNALEEAGLEWLEPINAMTVVLVLLWLWAVARRRFTDGRLFTLQTAGMVGFAALALLCMHVEPRLGAALAGVGFLAHGLWDGYHFMVDRVVNRQWSEFCGIVDLAVGVALIVVAVSG